MSMIHAPGDYRSDFHSCSSQGPIGRDDVADIGYVPSLIDISMMGTALKDAVNLSELPLLSSTPASFGSPALPRPLSRQARTGFRPFPSIQLPAQFEDDMTRLRDRCRTEGGRKFAVDAIAMIFADGITTENLSRKLAARDIPQYMPETVATHKPSAAFHLLIEAVGDRYTCGLCPDLGRERKSWKNKKDIKHHLSKFHFGISNKCNEW